MLADKLRRAGGSAGGLFVDDLFSTYLYTGNGSTQTITNGIDLAGEGGMVWIKGRNHVADHGVWDTERGVTNAVFPNTTAAQQTRPASITSFNSSGFTLGSDTVYNASTELNASWTFRRAPKFFDAVTYTGDGVAGREIPHNLGSVPGCIIVKCTSTTSDWYVYHRTLTGAPETDYLNLNTSTAYIDGTIWNDTAPTSTGFTLGSNTNVNGSAKTFVAYIFAHNDGDGGFGENSDEDIIKCGTAAANDNLTDLGFEPQWVLLKDASGAGDWIIVDNMRGNPVGGFDSELLPNLSNAETSTVNRLDITPTGFISRGVGRYRYIAIRRPHKPAESASEVFAVDTRDSTYPAYTSGFPVDFLIYKNVTASSDNLTMSRFTGSKILWTNLTNAEGDLGASYLDNNLGWDNAGSVNANLYSWMFKRSKGFFDVVCYTGTVPSGSAGSQEVVHGLDTAPEMMIVKSRDTLSGGSPNWWVYHKGIQEFGDVNGVLTLNTTNQSTIYNGNVIFGVGNNTSDFRAPTDTVFTVGANEGVNEQNKDYIAYLFASQAGISKVDSYTGNGTSQTIDCGFSTGARFFLVKATSTTGSWWVFDSARGIVSSFDPALQLNSTAAEITTADAVDPVASGIIVNQEATCSINATGVSYVFLAIA